MDRLVDFLLADPWMYGTTVTGTVTPNAGLAFADSRLARTSPARARHGQPR